MKVMNSKTPDRCGSSGKVSWGEDSLDFLGMDSFGDGYNEK
jgi:hypothetical protein